MATEYSKPYDNQDEVGAIWKKKSKKGEAYLSLSLNLEKLLKAGYTTEVQLVAFVNKNKKADKHPDLRIKISERRDAAAGAPITVASAPAPAKRVTRPAAPAPAPVEEAPVDDQELI
jgi:uncharacterized protein (DUF736 family)